MTTSSAPNAALSARIMRWQPWLDVSAHPAGGGPRRDVGEDPYLIANGHRIRAPGCMCQTGPRHRRHGQTLSRYGASK